MDRIGDVMMRTKNCKDSLDLLREALANAEEELALARADRDAMARSKDAWMAETNILHARLEEIGKLAGKELIFDR